MPIGCGIRDLLKLTRPAIGVIYTTVIPLFCVHLYFTCIYQTTISLKALEFAVIVSVWYYLHFVLQILPQSLEELQHGINWFMQITGVLNYL